MFFHTRLAWALRHSLHRQSQWPLLKHGFTGYTQPSPRPSAPAIPHLQGTKAALWSEEVSDPSSDVSVMGPGMRCIAFAQSLSLLNTAPPTLCPERLKPMGKHLAIPSIILFCSIHSLS